MKYAVLQISRGTVHLLIREDSDLICWEKRNFTPPPRMLLESTTIQEILDLIAEMIELARLQGVPVWEIYACMDLGMSTILNVNGILQRSKTELTLPIYSLKTDEEALWGWVGKTYGLQLRNGPTAWIDISHNAIFCVLGENGQVHQIERLQWSLLERTTHYWGKEPDRFKNNDLARMQSDIEQKLKTLEWTKRPHNLVVTGLPLTAFKRLFPLAEGKEYHNQSFSRATLRQWSEHLSQSHRKYRSRIMNDPTWTDGILTTTLLLMELCNRSYKDSFIMSDGELSLGILASLPSSEND